MNYISEIGTIWGKVAWFFPLTFPLKDWNFRETKERQKLKIQNFEWKFQFIWWFWYGIQAKTSRFVDKSELVWNNIWQVPSWATSFQPKKVRKKFLKNPKINEIWRPKSHLCLILNPLKQSESQIFVKKLGPVWKMAAILLNDSQQFLTESRKKEN